MTPTSLTSHSHPLRILAVRRHAQERILRIVEDESITRMAALRPDESNLCSLQNGFAILTNAPGQFCFSLVRGCVGLILLVADYAYRFTKSDHKKQQNTATPATRSNPKAISVSPFTTRSAGRNSGQSKSNS